MLLCWNGMSVYLYEIDQNTLKMSLSSELSLKSNIMAINNDSIINANNKNIELYTYDGEKKDQIPIKYDYGDISLFNVAHKFLLVVTVNNYFAVYDLERRGLKQTLSFRKFEKNGQSLGEIREAAINCKGNLIIFLTDNMINSEMRIPETKLIIYDVDMDSYIDYEISPNRIPIEITWDYSDWRIFAISTEYAKDLGEEDEKKDLYKSIIYTRNDDDNSVAQQNADWVGGELFLLFYTSENGVNSLESHKISRENQGIFGPQAPDIYFISSTPLNLSKLISNISISRVGTSIFSPFRAYSYNFLPLTFMADVIGGNCSSSCFNLSIAFNNSSLVNELYLPSNTIESVSRVSLVLPKMISAIYSLSCSLINLINLVALSQAITIKPVALGSSVPLWPVLLRFNFFLT
jgi:hypothetical protein